jgi:hypothetical protein
MAEAEAEMRKEGWMVDCQVAARASMSIGTALVSLIS